MIMSVIVGTLGIIKKRMDKHITKIPGSLLKRYLVVQAYMKYKKFDFVELLIGEYYQCD